MLVVDRRVSTGHGQCGGENLVVGYGWENMGGSRMHSYVDS